MLTEIFQIENHSNSANWGSSSNKFPVGSFHGHKFIMSAPFNDESLGHDSNDVSVLDGGQAVGNDDAGAPFSGFIQRCLHSLKATKCQNKNVQIQQGSELEEPSCFRLINHIVQHL